MKIGSYIFQDPWVFFLLGLIPLYLLYHFFYSSKRRGKVKSSTFQNIPSSGVFWLHIPAILYSAALALLIVGLARPQLDTESDTYIEQFAEGIDIVIAMDVSGSMLAKDFSPNRLEASKVVAKDFIQGRKNDRIGLVVYEAESFTQCPLTTDKTVLLDLFDEVQTGLMEGGTAIGMGLATAVNRLRESDARSRVVILLTDGVNTHGKIHPVSAAEIAAEFGIRVYTIGVGTNGMAPSPVNKDVMGNYIYKMMPVKIDEETLQEMAEIADGKYFRATDESSLEEVYKEIDKLEKDKIKTIEYEIDAPEKFFPWVLAGILCLTLGLVLQKIVFRTAP